MMDSIGVTFAMGIGEPRRSRLSSPAFSPAPPISKLRGVPTTARKALKRHKINTCPQLLAAAAAAGKRAALAQAAGIAPELLTTIVQRADMRRVQGIGAVFDMMLEEVGVCDVATLAQQDALRGRVLADPARAEDHAPGRAWRARVGHRPLGA
jgi:predicted flap endonuclease-1-like 5' DNA nuclease